MLPLAKLSIYSDDWVLKLCTISFWLYARPILNSHLSFMAAQRLVVRSWASKSRCCAKKNAVYRHRWHSPSRRSYIASMSQRLSSVLLCCQQRLGSFCFPLLSFIHAFVFRPLFPLFKSKRAVILSYCQLRPSILRFYSRLTLGKMVANTLISSERGVA